MLLIPGKTNWINQSNFLGFLKEIPYGSFVGDA